MTDPTSQALRVLPGRYVPEHHPAASAPPAGADWLSMVRGPDGLTVIRASEGGEEEAWAAVYSGDTAHDPEATGMLSAIVAPLAAAGVPVLAASTFQADIVLVPERRLEAAVDALRAAGHRLGG